MLVPRAQVLERKKHLPPPTWWPRVFPGFATTPAGVPTIRTDTLMNVFSGQENLSRHTLGHYTDLREF